MRANAEVLIVEDDAETLEELRAHFSRKRFHPLATRSAAHAVATLRNNAASTRPVLAASSSVSFRIVDGTAISLPCNDFSAKAFSAR